MRWIEAAFGVGSGGVDELCDSLAALGAEGLVIEDEEDFKRFLAENHKYWDYVDDELAARYRGVSRVKVYVAESDEGRRELARYTEALGREPTTCVVDDADWLNAYKKYYAPIEIGDALLVLPGWEQVPERCSRRVLRLDPGLAFGTGSHPTTRMCLESLEALAGEGKRVLDLGCGSGILGIGALVLGCASARGCDVDPLSPESAERNAALNGIGSDRYSMLVGDVLADAALRRELGGGYDIVLANIVSDVIIPLAPLARGFMAPGAALVTSGIIEGRQDEVARALQGAGLVIERHLRGEEWHSFLCRAAE